METYLQTISVRQLLEFYDKFQNCFKSTERNISHLILKAQINDIEE